MFYHYLYALLGPVLWTCLNSPDGAQLLQGQKVQSFVSVQAMTQQLTGNSLPLPQLLAWLDQDGADLPGWTLSSENTPNNRRVFAKRQTPLPLLELTLVIDPRP